MDSQEGVFANKVPMLKPNEFDMWKIRIRQHILLTDYSMWDVIENGPAEKKAGEDGVVPPPRTDAERKARQTEMKALSTLLFAIPNEYQHQFINCENAKSDNLEDKELDDLYNDLRVFEAEVEAKRKPIGYSHNTAPLSSESTQFSDSCSGFVNTVAGDSHTAAKPNFGVDQILEAFLASHVKSSLINEDLEQISADDLEEMDIKWQMAMLIMRIKRFIKRTGRNNFGMKREDGAGFDKSKVRCYKCNDLGHFARECKGNGQQHNNKSKFNKSSSASTSQALVSQEGFGFDWSDQAEEATQNQALMAEISETSSSDILADVSSKLCSKACVDIVNKYRDHNQNMCDSIKKLEQFRRESNEVIVSLEDQIKAYQANELQFEYDQNYWKWEKEYELKLAKYRSELEKVRTELEESKADLEKFSKASKAMDDILKAQINDDLKRGIGYNNTPPPYNNNYIPPKSNLADRLDTQDLKPGVTEVDPMEGVEVEDLGEEGETRKKEKIQDVPDENHILTNEKGGRPFLKSNSVDKGKGKEKNKRETHKQTTESDPSSSKQSEYKRGNQRSWNNQWAKSHGIDLSKINRPKPCLICCKLNHLARDCYFNPINQRNTFQRSNSTWIGRKQQQSQAKRFEPAYKRVVPNHNRPSQPKGKVEKKKVEKKYVKMVTKWVPKAVVSDIAASETNGNDCGSVKLNTAARNSSNSNLNTPQVTTTASSEKRKPYIVTKYSSHEIPSKDYLLKLNRLTEVNYGNQGRGKNLWHVDSGCSRHMTGIMSLLENFKRFKGGHVAFGDNPKGGKVSGKGKISKGMMTFEDVYYVEQLKYNMLSVSQVCDNKHRILFNDEECLILSPEFKIVDENMILLRAPRKDNVYCLDLEDVSSKSSLSCLLSKASLSESSLWHRRMCHMNFKNMNKLVKGNLKSYCLVIVDDYSRFTWIFFLRTKNETSGLIKPFVIRVENKTNLKVKVIRSDNGTKFKNDDLNNFCEEKGIERQYSALRTPQHNGVAERRNRTLIEATRTMVLVVKSKGKTPYELFEKKKPFIGFLKPFGCPCTSLNTKSHLGKFESKSEDGFLVGYSSQSKALRVFNSSSRIIEESDNVKCNENTPNLPGTGPNWLFDIDSLTNSFNMSYAVDTSSSADKPNETGTPFVMFSMPTVDPIKFCNIDKEPKTQKEGERDQSQEEGERDQTHKEGETEGTQDQIHSETHQEDQMDNSHGSDLNITNLDDSETNVIESTDQHEDHDDFESNLGMNLPEEPLHLTRTQKNHPSSLVIGDIQSPMITRKQSKAVGFQNPNSGMVSCFLSQTEPKKVVDAMKDPRWIEAMQEELLQFVLQHVWDLVDLPRGHKAIGTKWIFRNKKHERGIVIKNKARLVAQGYTQEEGIDYDDVFAPVARIEAIRLFLAFASYKQFKVFQMDVKSVFLYGNIEEENQFERGVIDKTLFIKKKDTDLLLVQIYVDDIIFGSTKEEMSSMGELTFFIGLQVKQKEDGIFINQSKYVKDMLTKFGFLDSKPASTPMETHKQLTADVEGEEVDVHQYRSMIGSLMYLAASRPDIMFAVCVCARFQVRPKDSHLQAVKRIFRYLKCNTRNFVNSNLSDKRRKGRKERKKRGFEKVGEPKGESSLGGEIKPWNVVRFEFLTKGMVYFVLISWLAEFFKVLKARICMANTRSQTGATRGPPDQTASTADQHVRVETVESPPRPQVLGGGPEHVPRINLEDPNPVLTEVTPEMRMLDNVMKAVNEAMSKQQESFMKMLEDHDASHRRNETVGENAGTASGDEEVVVVTEETRITGDKEKEKAKAKGYSYKNFLGCKPPEFRGCSDPVVCMYWLREMEMAFEASECDASLTWWNLNRSSLTPEVYARLSWAEFKKKMLEKYYFLEKLGMVEHLAPDEKLKIKAYSRGLPAEMRSAVRIARVTTLHEAIEESLRMEDDITQARVEGYQAGQKRRFEEAAASARPNKTFHDGKRGGSREEVKWCNKCRSKHVGPCRRDSSTSIPTCGKCGKRGHMTRDCMPRVAVCYECKEPGHYRDACLKFKKASTGGSSGPVAKGEVPPRVTSRAFQMTATEARETSDLVSAKEFTMPTTPLSDVLVVEVAGWFLVTVRDCFEGCTIELNGEPFSATLIPMNVGSFDVVLGIDWLRAHDANIGCGKKMVTLPTSRGQMITVYGDKKKGTNTTISMIKAKKCLAKGCASYLAYVIDTKLEKKEVADVDVVREFPDVFPEDLPGLPPERQVEFHIDLTSGGGSDSTRSVPFGSDRDERDDDTIARTLREGVHPTEFITMGSAGPFRQKGGRLHADVH
ncbi:hypothetical protein OSB04_017093 [Centaurea solstitialis]|uniref:Gag-pol polyprotein n=1 Tax=Centaurea solstitialis TaxID=347529 RepID=A0AA38T298_9ASTR|nr:hypothetical protein OSB04_017093 [Centaurea solstitialis]